MNPSHRNAALSLALIAALIGAFYWQPITGWFRPPPPEKLLIAITSDPSTGLLHIAAAKDYLAAEGLAVELQRHTSGRSALAALIAKQAEIATTASVPLMFAVSKQVPVSIVATIANTAQAEGVLARHDRGISAPDDLKGKTIGVPMGTSSHFMLYVMLAGNGIEQHAVTIRDLQPDALGAALSAGEVDAIAIWEPWLSAAQSPTSIIMYPDGGSSFAFHLASRPDVLQKRPAAMRKLLRALLRAERYAADEPEAARAIIAKAGDADLALIERAWPNYDLHLTLSQSLLNQLEDQLRWAISNGLLDASRMPNFLDNIYLDAMLAVKPHAVSIVR